MSKQSEAKQARPTQGDILEMARSVELIFNEDAGTPDAVARHQERVLAFSELLLCTTPHEPTSAGWMPIDTAPKNGTRLNLYWGDIPLFTGISSCYGSWDADKYATKPRPYWTHDKERLSGVKETRSNQPTHWMPLPAAPGCAA